MSTDTWWTIRQALVEYRDKDFSSATNEQIHAMTDALAADLESQLAEQQQPAPVSATEPDAVRMLREGMRGQHALFNVNQEYVCAVAPLLEYIDALTARLVEAERVTEEQVERACVAVAADLESQLAEQQQQPAPVSATEPEFPATFLFAPSSSEPKMLPAVAWLREEADTWSAFKGDEPDEPNTARTLNGIADYITTLRARLVEAERVTEEQVERAAIALYASTGANASSFRTEHHYAQKTYYDKARRALTAARGGG